MHIFQNAQVAVEISNEPALFVAVKLWLYSYAQNVRSPTI